MLLIVISFIGLCVFSLSDPVYIGDVIGTPKVAHNVTYENYSGKYTTLEYTYRDKEGIVFNRFIKFKSREDFEESTLQKGEKTNAETFNKYLGLLYGYTLCWSQVE